jgi:hypothetical protein
MPIYGKITRFRMSIYGKIVRFKENIAIFAAKTDHDG